MHLIVFTVSGLNLLMQQPRFITPFRFLSSFTRIILNNHVNHSGEFTNSEVPVEMLAFKSLHVTYMSDLLVLASGFYLYLVALTSFTLPHSTFWQHDRHSHTFPNVNSVPRYTQTSLIKMLMWNYFLPLTELQRLTWR